MWVTQPVGYNASLRRCEEPFVTALKTKKNYITVVPKYIIIVTEARIHDV